MVEAQKSSLNITVGGIFIAVEVKAIKEIQTGVGVL
jgi:hypothetical protein